MNGTWWGLKLKELEHPFQTTFVNDASASIDINHYTQSNEYTRPDTPAMSLQDTYINPFTDFGFKKLFGEEPNKALLISFLNALLPEHHQIEDLQYTRNEQQGASQLDRKAIFECELRAGS